MCRYGRVCHVTYGTTTQVVRDTDWLHVTKHCHVRCWHSHGRGCRSRDAVEFCRHSATHSDSHYWSGVHRCRRPRPKGPVTPASQRTGAPICADMGGSRAALYLLGRQGNPRTAGDGAQLIEDVVVTDDEIAERRV